MATPELLRIFLLESGLVDADATADVVVEVEV